MVTRDLTEAERKHLMSALAKIERTASKLLRPTVESDDSAIT
jgi:hypothetical protein